MEFQDETQAVKKIPMILELQERSPSNWRLLYIVPLRLKQRSKRRCSKSSLEQSCRLTLRLQRWRSMQEWQWEEVVWRACKQVKEAEWLYQRVTRESRMQLAQSTQPLRFLWSWVIFLSVEKYHWQVTSFNFEFSWWESLDQELNLVLLVQASSKDSHLWVFIFRKRNIAASISSLIIIKCVSSHSLFTNTFTPAAHADFKAKAELMFKNTSRKITKDTHKLSLSIISDSYMLCSFQSSTFSELAGLTLTLFQAQSQSTASLEMNCHLSSDD